MSDLAVGLGLVLVLEGLLWALAPDFARRMLQAALSAPERELSIAGWIAVATGLVLVWVVRG